MPRLAEEIVGRDGELDFVVAGKRDGDGRCFLTLSVSGKLVLRCQRCLGGMEWSAVLDSKLLLVPSGEEWPDEDLAADDCDAIAADRDLSLLPLIEEEIMLALPMAPMHENCGAPTAVEAGQCASPFATLANLKDH